MNTMTLSEIRDLLVGADDRLLFSGAEEVRSASFGKDVYLRGVIEFSNHCVKQCLYCGLRKPNSAISRYRLKRAEILEAASVIPGLDIGTVVLQSGDDYRYGGQIIGEIIRDIKRNHDVAVTLSMGDRKKDEYRFWRDCGADRYLLKIETFNKELHQALRPDRGLDYRLSRLEWLRSLGYEVGSGIIIGLPGMNADILARDLLELTRLDLDMIAVGPFVPHPDTPLGSRPAGDLLASYRSVALLRVMNPRANIPATSSLAALSKDGKVKALQCGANIVMPSVTPESVRKSYNIYPGKNTNFLRAIEEVEATKALIRGCGLVPSSSKGFSMRNNK